MPVFSASKAAGFADEWTCDNAANFILPTQNVAGGLANLIQPRNWNYFFMGRNLKHRIRGCIYDWLPCLNVFGAEFFNNFCPGSRFVPQNARNTGLTNETI